MSCKVPACWTASGSNSRALATSPRLLLLDEIGGGLTDAEASELVDTIRSLHARGIGIVWIEYVVHILLQVAERLVCMDAGRIIAEGDTDTVMSDAQVVSAYLGGAGMCILGVTDLDVRYGQFRAVHDVSFNVEQGEIPAHVGANGAGKTTLLRALAGANPVKAGIVHLSGTDITHLPSHLRVDPVWRWCPKGASCSST